MTEQNPIADDINEDDTDAVDVVESTEAVPEGADVEENDTESSDDEEEDTVGEDIQATDE